MREMTRRRLEVFKSNRRAYYSAYLLLFFGAYLAFSAPDCQ